VRWSCRPARTEALRHLVGIKVLKGEARLLLDAASKEAPPGKPRETFRRMRNDFAKHSWDRE